MYHYIAELRSIRPDAVTFYTPRCPMCGAEADTFYKSESGEILGCSECVIPIDSVDYFEEAEE